MKYWVELFRVMKDSEAKLSLSSHPRFKSNLDLQVGLQREERKEVSREWLEEELEALREVKSC